MASTDGGVGNPVAGCEAGIAIELTPIGELKALEAEWLDLQARSDHGFFESWGWVNCWLRSVPAGIRPLRLAARRDGLLAGLGLLGEYRRRRYALPACRTVGLLETGHRLLDKQAIEHNGFLIDRRWATEVRRALLGFLARAVAAGRWDEARLSCVPTAYRADLADEPGVRAVVIRNLPSRCVDLVRLRSARMRYVDALSRNARQQLRRSRRLFETRGAVAIREAACADEALEFLAALLERHRVRWRGRFPPSAFIPPFAQTFHRQIVTSRFAHGEIQMLRASAGDCAIGYLYNFAYRGRVSFYQSGLDFEPASGSRPGLVSHWLAVEHNLDRGSAAYDFLPGEERYKRRLATDSEERLWLVLQRDRLDLRVEAAVVPALRRWGRQGLGALTRRPARRSAPAATGFRDAGAAVRRGLVSTVRALDTRITRAALALRRERPALLCLMVHTLFADEREAASGLVDPFHPVLVANLRACIDYFLACGYRFVTPAEVADGLDPGGHYVWITFDDGYANNLLAVPVLRELGVPATFFIATNHVLEGTAFWWDVLYRARLRRGGSLAQIRREQLRLKARPYREIRSFLHHELGPAALRPLGDIDRPLNRQELAALAAEPLVSLGNHTADHAILTLLADDQARAQIRTCQSELASVTGRPPEAIAFPDGAHDARVVRLSREEGLRLGVRSAPSKNALPLDDAARMRIGRHALSSGADVRGRCLSMRGDYRLGSLARWLLDD